MKKFLTLFVATAVTLSAAAVDVKKEISGKNLELRPLTEMKSNFRKVDQTKIQKKAHSNKPAKVFAASDLSGTWAFTFGDFFGEDPTWDYVTFKMGAELEGLEVFFYDPTDEYLPLVAVADEANDAIVVNAQFICTVNYEGNAYYVYQQPFDEDMDWETNDSEIIPLESQSYWYEEGYIEGDYLGGIQWLACTAEDPETAIGYFEMYGFVDAEKISDNIPERPTTPEWPVIGTMSGYTDMNMGQGEPDLSPYVEECPVKGYYEDGKLTISGMLNLSDVPVTFTIDLTTGEAVAENCYISNEYGFDMYYGDVETMKPNLYGQMYNTSENTSELVLRPWGELCDASGPEFGEYGWFFDVVFYNTVAELNFAIEGLPMKGAVDFEIPAGVEGKWSFTLNGHYLGDYSLGTFTEEFVATLEGATIRFASSGSQYDIIGEFTSPTTIAFKKAAVTNSTYALTQVPYVNNNYASDVEDLESDIVEELIGTYYPETGQISFPFNSGLLYGYFDAQGNLSYWDDAFDVLAAVKATDIEVSEAVVVSVAATTATIAVTPVFSALPEGAEVYVTLSNGYEAAIEEAFTGVSGSTAEIVLTGLTANTEYQYSVSAVVKKNGEVVTSATPVIVRFTTTDVADGVENIAVDANGNAQLFNLNGTRVNGTNVPAGVYVKVVNGKATKVIVK